MRIRGALLWPEFVGKKNETFHYGLLILSCTCLKVNEKCKGIESHNIDITIVFLSFLQQAADKGP